MIRPRRTLRVRIALSLLVYSLLLSVAILLQGYVTNERIESVVWRSLLNAEIDRWLEERMHDAQAPLPHSGTITGYVRPLSRPAAAPVPTPFRLLPPGLYNGVMLGQTPVAVLVRDVGAQRIYMTVKIAQVEAKERSLFGWVALWALFGAVALMLIVGWLSGRLLRPVTQFALDVDALTPEALNRRVVFSEDAGAEVATIAAAINRYLERIDGFVSRERRFIDSVSHELRTPISVIGGAADVMLARSDLPDSARKTVRRIRQTVDGTEELIAALLVLAREPHRLLANGESCQLGDVLVQIVADHGHLTRGKELALAFGTVEPSWVLAPCRIVQVALANLVRNAIEHSDHGQVTISVGPPGVVTIADPGHGLDPEEIGRRYAEVARSAEALSGAGIGLELIRRICEHLGWTLHLQPGPTGGTVATLDLRPSLQPRPLS